MLCIDMCIWMSANLAMLMYFVKLNAYLHMLLATNTKSSYPAATGPKVTQITRFYIVQS